MATLQVDPVAFPAAADAGIRAAQAMMADAVADVIRRAGLPDEAASSIREAWLRSEPTFAARPL